MPTSLDQINGIVDVMLVLVGGLLTMGIVCGSIFIVWCIASALSGRYIL
jgi:hypothetical protein